MPRKRVQVRAEPLFRFAEIIGGRHLICTTVGPRLDPVLLSLEETPDYRIEQPGWASYPKKQAARPNHFRIHHRVVDDVWTTVDLPETVENYHDVQPLGGEQWLLLRGRAYGEDDCNAHVFDSTGKHLRSFYAGDGIQDMQVTANGQVWVSYFDEGVLSGKRLSESGLVCLDAHGECSFRYPGADGGEPPGITDCYALNVASDRVVWLYYYTDFPLVRLVDGKVDCVWLNLPVDGSSAFAVRGDKVLFVGGYRQKDDLFLVHLATMKRRSLLAIDDRNDPITPVYAFGREGSLFLQTDESLFLLAAHAWDSIRC